GRAVRPLPHGQPVDGRSRGGRLQEHERLGRPVRADGRIRSGLPGRRDRKSTRLNSSHLVISYAVFCLKKKTVSLTIAFQDAPPSPPFMSTLSSVVHASFSRDAVQLPTSITSTSLRSLTVSILPFSLPH